MSRNSIAILKCYNHVSWNEGMLQFQYDDYFILDIMWLAIRRFYGCLWIAFHFLYSCYRGGKSVKQFLYCEVYRFSYVNCVLAYTSDICSCVCSYGLWSLVSYRSDLILLTVLANCCVVVQIKLSHRNTREGRK
jgi:hypothetical protein